MKAKSVKGFVKVQVTAPSKAELKTKIEDVKKHVLALNPADLPDAKFVNATTMHLPVKK